jgi:hypothetical protein
VLTPQVQLGATTLPELGAQLRVEVVQVRPRAERTRSVDRDGPRAGAIASNGADFISVDEAGVRYQSVIVDPDAMKTRSSDVDPEVHGVPS